jgi:zinc transport system ATP-binding protein
MSLIDAHGVSVRLGGTTVLSHVTLSIAEREIVTIVGPNGSGKSTLLKALLGAVPLSAGHVARADDLRVGYVPQKLHIDPTLPLPVLRFLGLPKRVPRAVAMRALERTGVPDLADRQVADLSGGQMQRVLLARAIINNPQLLVLDEATQGLDQSGSAAFYRLIEELREEMGCGVLMVSHELHVVMAASDRVICLNGHDCCEGAPEHVATAPEYRALFGTGTQGALALYRHEHNHTHDHAADHSHESHEAAQ